MIRIVDSRTIIVNAGKGDLETGNIIQVYEPGEMLKDVDGKDLCTYDFVVERYLKTIISYLVSQKYGSIQIKTT